MFPSHKLVAFWGEGTQVNAPVQSNPSAGIAFRGRSYRLNGTRNSTTAQEQANTPPQQTNSAGGAAAFRGTSYRLGGQ